MNHFKLSYANPFRFVKKTSTPGIHFDSSWACEQIRFFELRRYYKQKWCKKDTTPLQCESSIKPEPLRLVNKYNGTVKEFEWVAVVLDVNYTIYETTYDVTDVPEGTYYLTGQVAFLAIDWNYISEPIDIREVHPHTLRYEYKNSYSSLGIAWPTGIRFVFRCESDIQDYEPLNDKNDYVNQLTDTTVLSAIPSDQFQLYIGDAPGVAPWVIKWLNMIFSCDYVSITDDVDKEAKRYTNKSGSSFKITRTRGYPLVGASLDLVPSLTEDSLTFQDDQPLAPEIVTGYNIKTAFFGPGAVVPIIEITR